MKQLYLVQRLSKWVTRLPSAGINLKNSLTTPSLDLLLSIKLAPLSFLMAKKYARAKQCMEDVRLYTFTGAVSLAAASVSAAIFALV